MKASRSVARLLVAATLLAATAAAGVVGSAPAASAAACTLCSGGEFHPLAVPVRPYTSPKLLLSSPAVQVDLLQFDRSSGAPVPTALSTLGPDVQRSDVLAVLAAVHIANPSNSGTARLWGGDVAPSGATITFKAGQTTTNMVLLQPDANGLLWLKSATSATLKRPFNASIDVVGWFSTSTYDGVDVTVDTADDRGLRLTGLASPARFATGTATPTAPLMANVRTAVDVQTGQPALGAIAPESVQAALINVTVVKPAATTGLRVGSADEPGTALGPRTMSIPKGATVSTLVVAPLAADGRVMVRVSAGAVPVAMDLVGAFTVAAPGDETTTGRVVPLGLPFRAFDTSLPAFGAAALGPNQAEDWSFAAFASSVTLNGAAIGAQSGLLGNVITTRLARQSASVPVSSSLRIFAAGAAKPLATVVNMPGGTQPVANMALVPYGSNAVARTHNRAGYLHYLLDVYAVVLS